MTTEQQLSALIGRLIEIYELLDVRGSDMTPRIHGKASALVNMARMDALALGRAMRVELGDLRLALAKAEGTEDEYYDQLAAKAAKEN